MAVEITHAEVADINRLIDGLHPECAGEFVRGGLHPEKVICNACDMSDALFRLRLNGEMVGIFGFCHDRSKAEEVGLKIEPHEFAAFAWATSTTKATERFVEAAKESRRIMASALSIYDVLYTLADPDYTRTCRWLRWIGFEKVGKYERFDLMVARR